MKIEFIEEQKLNESVYLTNVDGNFVPGSLSYDKELAYKRYQTIVESVKNGRGVTLNNILESVEINTNDQEKGIS